MNRSRFHCLLAVLLFCIFAGLGSANAVMQSQIDALKSEAGALASQREDLQNQIDSMKSNLSAATDRKELLDRKISILSEQIRNTASQITEYTVLINQAEAELSAAQAKEASQQELFRKRVRAMEERGAISYWSVLFRANSFSDMLGRLDFINEIMDSDQAVIRELQQLQNEIQTTKTVLVQRQSELQTAKATLSSQKFELDTQRADANVLIRELNAGKIGIEDAMDDLSAEEDEIQNQILQLSRELAAQQSAGSGQTSTESGGYIWPVPSRKVTSTFGGRSSPGGIGSTNHKGIDIGGVGYTTPVSAVKNGTVIISQYSKSYGNYVVVSHSSGNTALYAHMSSRSVSVGQEVQQGDRLGITGSTGNSTGPHIHLEITENGSRVNPLKYLSGYTLAG